MKKIILLFVCNISITVCFSQKTTIKWGDEFKLNKGSTDLYVVYADNSGVYLQESHMLLRIGAPIHESATLIKLDASLNEQYKNDFNKELKGKSFEQFFVLKNKVYIISSDYSSREKILTLFIAQIEKNTGELSSQWKQIANWQKDEKKDEISFKVSYNADSSKMVLVSTIEGKEKNSYYIQEFDEDMNTVSPPVTVSNEFDPKTFQLEDILYTSNKKIVLVGRLYEYEEGKKKKEKYLDFMRYNIRIYNEKGNMLKEINTDINGKWLISSKVVQEHDQDLILTAFYSNVKKGGVDGLLVERINADNGEIITDSQKEINASLISTLEEDNTPDDKDEESKQERKERENLNKIKDEGEGFSKNMRFRNVFYTADKGLIILTEKFRFYTYTSTYYSAGSNGMPGRWTTVDHQVYESGDMIMFKINETGNVSWLQVLPKLQREVMASSSSYGSGFSIGSSFFAPSNMPFYSGFGAVQNDNTITIIFNDHTKNADVLQLGQKVKIASYFRKSDCFTLTLDANTGKYTRSLFFSNTDIPTAMPRLGSVIAKNMYMVGKEDRFLGKTKIAVAKITIAH